LRSCCRIVLMQMLVMDDSFTHHAPAEAHAQAPSLRRYIDETLASNAALHAEEQSVEAGRQALIAAQRSYWPQVDLNARYSAASGGRTFDIPSGELVNPVYRTLNQITAGTPQATNFPQVGDEHIRFLRSHEQDTRLSLAAPLFRPELDADVDIRRGELTAAASAREALARELVRNVKQAYFNLARIEASRRILQDSQAALEEEQRVAARLIDNGKATRDRLLRAQAEVLAVQQQLLQSDNQGRRLRRYLNVLRNTPEDSAVDVAAEDVPAGPAPDAYDERSALRPELRELDGRLSAAGAAVRRADSGFLPTVSLQADLGIQGEHYAVDRDTSFGTVSIVLSWKLFDAGIREADRGRALAQQQQLRATRQDLDDQLRLALHGAQDDVRTAQASVHTAEARAAAAAEAFRIAERKRDSGALSQLEFLDAEHAVTEARLTVAIARFELHSSIAQLEFAAASYPLPALQEPAP
jgi:outer membrane protein TolC